MKKDQEARILGNQALIMQALEMLMADYPAGRGAMRNELERRRKDNETFIRDYLK